MIKKYIIGLCVSVGLLYGCEKERGIEGNVAGGEIVLNAVFDGASRVSAKAFDENDRIGVFVTEYDGDTETALKVSGNYVDNHLFVAASSSLSTEKPLFYPQENNVDIYGYHPYEESVASVDAYPFKVASDQSEVQAFKGADFVWAKRANVAANNSVVNLNFQHRMTKVVVNIEAGTEIADLDGLVVTIRGVVGESRIDLATGKVTPLAEATQGEVQPLDVTATSSGVTKRSYEAIIVPQVVAEGTILVEAELNGKKYTYRVGEGGQIFGSGKQQGYDLVINAFQRGLLLKSASVTNWVSNGTNVNEQIIPDVEGRDVLMALYHAADGANWTNKTNWGTDKPIGEWYGITVEDNEIVAISLANNGLKGKLPIGLTKLPRLRKLLLNDNALADTIPAELGNMNTLEELNLANNQLTKTIPSTLGRLRNLTLLNLRGNRLSGVIPRLVTYLNCYTIDHLALQYAEDGVTEITLLEEGVAQEGEKYAGDIEFTSQAQINTFALHGYTEVLGNVSILGDGAITNIPEFTGLKKIHGHLYIENSALEDFTPFKDLTYIGGDLGLSRCWGLKSFTDNDKLEYIGGMFYMNSMDYGNANLFEISGFNNVATINKGISLTSCRVTKISGFENLIELGGKLHVNSKDVEEVSGFTNLKKVKGNLLLHGSKLKIVPSFPNLETIEGDLEISAAIVEFAGLSKLSDVGMIVFGSCSQLEKVSGFENLKTLTIRSYGSADYGSIIFRYNPNLVAIPEFNNLTSIPSGIEIIDCKSLLTISGFKNLQSMGGTLRVSSCPMLKKMSGFDSLVKTGRIDIYDVPMLTVMSKFPALKESGCVDISNTGLENIDGFNLLEKVDRGNIVYHYIEIYGNNKLKTISGFNKIVSTEIYIGVEFATYGLYEKINPNPLLEKITGFTSLTSSSEFNLSGNVLTSLEGFSNLESIGVVRIYKSYLLTSFPLTGVKEISSWVDLQDNTNMEDYTKLQAALTDKTSVIISNCKYNPTKEDILAGKVKPE